MRRKTLVYLITIFCLLSGLSQGTQAQYEAVVTVDFQLREKPKEEARRLTLLKEGGKVSVFSMHGEWSQIQANGKTGYARTAWLSKFVSLDPFSSPVPGYLKQKGIARVKVPVHAMVPGYTGNTIKPGDLLSVLSYDSLQTKISMMRETALIPSEALDITPFVPWDLAQPGDIISGFTTFYNEETGGTMAKSRAFNIELAALQIHETTISSQQAFSFNAACGPYKKSKGYLIAPNISQEGKGYGGGVCQLSTTLYNAALALPLRIDKWRVHRESGVAYIPQYFDAAVGTYSDLAFTNLLPYAVSLEVLTQEGVLTLLIKRAAE